MTSIKMEAETSCAKMHLYGCLFHFFCKKCDQEVNVKVGLIVKCLKKMLRKLPPMVMKGKQNLVFVCIMVMVLFSLCYRFWWLL